MADVTISQLDTVPNLAGSYVLPISNGSTTYKTTVASLTSTNLLPLVEATGGTVSNIIVNGIKFKVHSFSTAGSFIFNVTQASNNPTVEVLIVGGGGSGGSDLGGGGGGGGVFHNKCVSITTGSKTVVVGAGGATPGTIRQNNTYGRTGVSSQFDVYTVLGGGGGGAFWEGSTDYTQGRSGGSGGGSAPTNGNFVLGGTGSRGANSILGGNGGQGANNGWCYSSGGGGGAGGNGHDARYCMGGAGGDGYCCDITGVATYYAGGGGGQVYNGSVNYTLGGLGGGGRSGAFFGSAATSGEAGTNGLGGGGGGGGGSNSSATGGAGGSGVVIIRYPIY